MFEDQTQMKCLSSKPSLFKHYKEDDAHLSHVTQNASIKQNKNCKTLKAFTWQCQHQKRTPEG